MSKQNLGDEEETFSSDSYSEEALKMEFENLSFTPFNSHPEPQNKAQPTTTNTKRHNQGKKESQAQKKKNQKERKERRKKHEQGRQPSGVKLKYVEPTEDGIIRFKKEDLLSVEEAWGICLVGYFDGKNPGKKALAQIRDQWKVWSHVRYYNGWIVFNFEYKEDLDKVLCGGPYSACGSRLVLKAMPEEPFALRERPRVSNEWLV